MGSLSEVLEKKRQRKHIRRLWELNGILKKITSDTSIIPSEFGQGADFHAFHD